MAARGPWKLGWWDVECDPAKTTKQFVKTKYNRPDVSDFINVAKGQAKKDDWLLCLHLSKGKTRKPSMLEWMFVDHVIEVANSDKGAYEKDYPYQAVQVFPSTHYPFPPFTLDADFKRAFTKAISDHDIERQSTPSKELLGDIASELKNLPSGNV
jgi:hypothetical protein